MGLDFGNVNQQGFPPRQIGGGGGGNAQVDQQLLAMIIEMFRRAQQGQGQQQPQQPAPQATPPDIGAGTLLNRAFPQQRPTQRTAPLGGIGNRQALFNQTVQAPSGQNQVVAAIASALRNVTNARSRKNQGRP